MAHVKVAAWRLAAGTGKSVQWLSEAEAALVAAVHESVAEAEEEAFGEAGEVGVGGVVVRAKMREAASGQEAASIGSLTVSA